MAAPDSDEPRGGPAAEDAGAPGGAPEWSAPEWSAPEWSAPDPASVFCVAFALLAYKLMFWTERPISAGSVLLCAMCAFALAQLATGGATRTGMQALAALARPALGAGSRYLCTAGVAHLPMAVREMLCAGGAESAQRGEL